MISTKVYHVPMMANTLIVALPLEWEELYTEMLNGIYEDDKKWINSLPSEDLRKVIKFLHARLMLRHSIDFDWDDAIVSEVKDV